MLRIAILGSTGSIGQSALAVVAAHPDRVRVVALAAGENIARFVEQVAAFAPDTIAMSTPRALADACHALERPSSATIRAMSGPEGLIAVATHPDVDLVLFASSGTAALDAVLAAIEAGKTIALANKEVLVMAGAIVMAAARRKGVAVLPVDSEHNAIHQCLHGRSPGDVRRLILTASGGPFRDLPVDAIETVTPEEALRHPTWTMGPKITIDSATLMNKGLELIEAHHLFGFPYENIEVVVHPESIVHAVVHLNDGSSIAHLGYPDMLVPISYALHYPERVDVPVRQLDLAAAARLTFEAPDLETFRCLALARDAAMAGGTGPCVLNAANEIAVHAFLEGTLGFVDIPRVIQGSLEAVEPTSVDSFDDLFDADAEARGVASALVQALSVEA